MLHDAHLWLFFIIVFGVVILPGLEMAYVLGSALTGGRTAGLVAVAGIMAGSICLVLMTTLGISVLINVIPGAFNALLIVGALYIAWIGFSILRSQTTFAAVADTHPHSSWVTFRRGILTNLLNPKAYLFMLAIFPQFLRPEYGPLWIQAMVLWFIIAVAMVSVYGSVAIIAGKLRHWLASKPTAGITINRIVGSTLILAAIFTGYHGWQGH